VTLNVNDDDDDDADDDDDDDDDYNKYVVCMLFPKIHYSSIQTN